MPISQRWSVLQGSGWLLARDGTLLAAPCQAGRVLSQSATATTTEAAATLETRADGSAAVHERAGGRRHASSWASTDQKADSGGGIRGGVFRCCRFSAQRT
jgi:hypothetical protein